MYKLILMIGLLTFSIGGFAQEEEGDDKKKKKCDDFLELTMGLNGSTIGGESDSYDGFLLGLFFGLGLDVICFENNIRMHAGLGFSMQGSKYKQYQYEPGGGESNSGKEARLRLNYLVIPVTAQYRSNKGFTAEAGLQPGILLSAKDKHSGGTDDAKDLYNTFDMGVVVGAGYQPPNKKWGIGLRVVPGITNINKSSSPYDVKDKNFNTSLRVTYKI